jgi:hypothetical protein
MPQNCYHFYFLKTVYFLYLVTVSKNILICFRVSSCIICIFSFVGNAYNYSELLFCMTVKIQLCLHFPNFTTHKCMFSTSFFSCKTSNLLLILYLNIIKHMFDISIELKRYGFLMNNWVGVSRLAKLLTILITGLNI